MSLDLPPSPIVQAIAYLWFSLLGGVVGSFLNVVIARLPAGESVVRPRSRCPRCRTPIDWYDNLPVLSWLILRARCRACGLPISIRYPLVELAVAGAGALAFARHGASLVALAELAFVAALVALACIDLDTWLLPHAITWPLLAAGVAASALGLAAAPSWRSSALGAAAGFGAFALVAVVGEKLARKEVMGFGDVFLLGGLGAWLGAGALLPVVLLSSLQGSVIGLALLYLGRGDAPSPGPGPEPEPQSSEIASDASPTPASTAADSTVTELPDGNASAPPGPAAEPEWVPDRHAVPFGPFLVAAALEWLYLAPALASAVPVLRAFL